jgi:hypothetical protein
MEFDQILRLLEDQERKLSDRYQSSEFYKRRCVLLEKVQKHMRNPERTIVCDILENGKLLPDPNGERYGFDPKELK